MILLKIEKKLKSIVNMSDKHILPIQKFIVVSYCFQKDFFYKLLS